MATITRQTRNFIEKYPFPSDESERDICAGLCQCTNLLKVCYLDPHDPLIDRLANQAIKLHGPSTALIEYLGRIDQLAAEATTSKNPIEMSQKIDEMRVESYHLAPHNREELLRFIEAKQKLHRLERIFQFCTKASLANSSEEKISLKNLVSRFDSVTDIQALTIARETLRDRVIKPKIELPIAPIEEAKPSCCRRFLVVAFRPIRWITSRFF
jgi:hypothetical protein